MYDTKDGLIGFLKSVNKPIIIYGCGFVGKIAEKVLEESGIKVDAFCDDSKDLHGSSINNVEIIHTPKVAEQYPDAIYLVSILSAYKIIRYFKSNNITNWYYAGVLLQDIDVKQKDTETYVVDLEKRRIQNCVDCHTVMANKDSIVIPNVSFAVTECCTLKCKDCSNLMPYYKNPRNTSLENMEETLDNLLEYVDEIPLMTFVGGESWLNPAWPEIFQRIIESDKIKEVTIITNGTLMPDDKYTHLLQNKKVIVAISDYGKLSTKIEELREYLVTNKIWHYEVLQDTWYKGHEVKRHNRSYEANCKIFTNCNGTNCPMVYDSKLFICQYLTHALRVAELEDCNDDYLDLKALIQKGYNRDQIREAIESYFVDTEVIECCDYCLPFSTNSERVEPAVQLKK